MKSVCAKPSGFGEKKIFKKWWTMNRGQMAGSATDYGYIPVLNGEPKTLRLR